MRGCNTHTHTQNCLYSIVFLPCIECVSFHFRTKSLAPILFLFAVIKACIRPKNMIIIGILSLVESTLFCLFSPQKIHPVSSPDVLFITVITNKSERTYNQALTLLKRERSGVSEVCFAIGKGKRSTLDQ